MGIILLDGNFILDQESEKKIIELADKTLKEKYADEYDYLLKKFRDIVFFQEVASYKNYLEHRHPEQVNQIDHLRSILNNKRIVQLSDNK